MTNDILNGINSQKSDNSSVKLPELTSEQKQLLRQQLLQEILETQELNEPNPISVAALSSSTVDTTSSAVTGTTSVSSNTTVTTIDSTATTTSSTDVNSNASLDASDTSPKTMNQAASTLVQHVGDFITKSGSFNAPPAALVVEDIQQLWKAKTSDHTVASTVSTLWDSVKQSEHLPTLAGMLASIFVKKP